MLTGFFLAFGIIYESFSHGVYDPAMYLAFLVPLFGGLIPTLVLWMRPGAVNRLQVSPLTLSIWDAAVLTLTLGCVISGVLTIYGTSNRLIRGYWLAGGGLVLAAILLLDRDLRGGGKRAEGVLFRRQGKAHRGSLAPQAGESTSEQEEN